MRDSPTDSASGQPNPKVIFSPAVWALLVFLLALAPRLPGLRLFLTTDEPYFVEQAADVIGALLRGDFGGTYWHFYPGVTISWLVGLGLSSQWVLTRLLGASGQLFQAFIQEDILDLIIAVRLPYVFLSAAGVAGFYLLARRLLGHRTALLGALFIAFDPFFLAHSRVAHGDAPVTVFMGMSALAFLVYLEEEDKLLTNTRGAAYQQGKRPTKSRWWLILSAAMGALASLTKAPGQFMVIFVVLLAVGAWLLNSSRLGNANWRLARRWLVDLALWGGVAVLMFVVLWPAMWANPVGTVVRMLDETFGKVEEGHLVFFMGRPTLNPGPWFYPYVISFRMTPVTLIGVILSVVLIVLKPIANVGKRNEEGWRPSCYTVAALLWFYVVSLLVFGNLSPKKQDRYLLPLLPFLDLLAAFAYMEIAQIISQQISKWTDRQHAIRSMQYALVIALPLSLLLIHGLPVVTNYPYYLAYFNPLMGGLPRAVQTTLAGWGEGMEKAAAYLNQSPDADQLYVAAVPAQTFLPYFEGTGENFYTNDVALRADYVVFYVSQVQRLAPSPEIVRYFRAMEPEHTVHVRGVPYAWIYPSPKIITSVVPPGATPANFSFGDQLRLAGYRISNTEPSQLAHQQNPVSELEVALCWNILSPLSDDYTVSVRLVAPDGTWLAQHDGWPGAGLIPTSQLRQGDYVQDVHRLGAPPDAMVDRVQVVVYDAASGQPLSAPIDLPVADGGDE